MDILKLFIVFCVIILVMWLKKPISIAVLAATVVTILIYRLPIATACSAMIKGATSWTTIEALLVFYSITFLQRMLEKRQQPPHQRFHRAIPAGMPSGCQYSSDLRPYCPRQRGGLSVHP